MKVAILTSAIDERGGGWGRYSVNLARALTNQGIDVTFFTEDPATPKDLNVLVFRLRSRPSSGIKNVFLILSDWWMLRGLIKEYDVVHAFTETHLFLAWLLGRPYIVSTHGTYTLRFLKKPFFKWFAQRAFSCASAVIVTSEFTFEKIRPYVKVKRTTQLPNGVDLKLFKRDPAIQREPHTIITVGGIKARKGQDLVVRALAELKKTFPDSKYLIVGESGGFQSVVDTLIKENNLQTSVVFAGTPDDTELVKFYNQAGVFVLASRVDSTGSFEGYPLSLLEASAVEMPIIGSYGCGAEHLITPGKNGFLMHEDNVGELVSQLRTLFSDQAESFAMGKRAYAVAREFSWDKNAEKVVEIYNLIKNEK